MQNLTTKIFKSDLFKSKESRYISIAVLIFISVNIFLIAKDFYWLSLLPVVILLIYWLLYKTTNIVFLITLFTPLTINYYIESQGFSISLPTEPLMAATLLLFLIKNLIVQDYDKKVLKHPVTIAILINLIWILVTSISSTIPLVSFKFFFSRLWFLAVFYFMLIPIFKDKKNIKKFIWLYASTLIIVIFYTLYQHSAHFFTHEKANLASRPFYRDHTVYGAVLAMYFPVVFGLFWKRKMIEVTKYGGIIALGFSVIILVAIILSYTRAAWISMAVAFGFLVMLLLKVKLRTMIIMLGMVLLIVTVFWSKILLTFTHNDSTSSTDLKDHVQSISNIQTDASNSERINRWKCAIRMFKEKPFLGWGPGTYMFQYAPFQMSYEKTIISTNRGDMGNSHSEYLGPLCESGVFGTLAFLGIALMIINTGMSLFFKGRNPFVKIMTLLLLLSIVTYLAHGFMNNFLDSDKAAIPFWGFIAAIVAMDIYHNKEILNTDSNEEN